tara:strand:- start:225 stop:638 length:414 start_codon:yes stop_codon:yes gene_type:complete
MESEFIKVLIDYGLAGVFIGYMIWQSLRHEKKNAAQQARYEARIDELRKESSDGQEKIRARYADVIQKYDLQISTYAEERRNQIAAYSEERNESRRVNSEIRRKLDETLTDIKNQIAQNGNQIARLQEQVSLLMRGA